MWIRLTGFGKCPILVILNITFKYLLEMKYPQYLGDVKHWDVETNPCLKWIYKPILRCFLDLDGSKGLLRRYGWTNKGIQRRYGWIHLTICWASTMVKLGIKQHFPYCLAGTTLQNSMIYSLDLYYMIFCRDGRWLVLIDWWGQAWLVQWS